MSDKPVHIIVIADRSGSMDQVRDDAIGGFNTFLEQQKEEPGEAVFGLILFDHEYEVAVADVPIQQVEALTRQTYVPRGKTALYDAVGRTIGEAIVSSDDYDRTIVAILTDGQENDSKEITETSVIRALVEQAEEEHGFHVFYISADIHAFVDAKAMGIADANVMSYTASGAGTRAAYDAMSHTVASARTADSK